MIAPPQEIHLAESLDVLGVVYARSVEKIGSKTSPLLMPRCERVGGNSLSVLIALSSLQRLTVSRRSSSTVPSLANRKCGSDRAIIVAHRDSTSQQGRQT